jgi:hypothetical protein
LSQTSSSFNFKGLLVTSMDSYWFLLIIHLYNFKYFHKSYFFIDSGQIQQLQEAEMIGNTHFMFLNVFRHI